MFRKATRQRARARVAIDGPAKAGKSFTALRLAFALGKRVAAIDTEFGSLSKYAGESPDGIPFDFDVLELKQFGPDDYVQAIKAAQSYDVLVIDSLSHAWVGVGGALDQKDQAVAKGANNFTAWAKVSPGHARMIDAILACPCHVVATMRSKMEYVLEESVNKAGKTVQTPKKIGLAPVQREGMEYEFDLLLSVDQDHHAVVHGSRCSEMDGKNATKPGAAFFAPYVEWLGKGDSVPVLTPAVLAPSPPPTPAPTFTPSANGQQPSAKATEQQLEQLGKLRAHVFLEKKVEGEQAKALWKQVLADFNVTTAKDLTTDQADELLKKLSPF